MPQKQQRVEAFQVEYRGKAYAYERVIQGVHTLTQQIHVIGVGSKYDSARYGIALIIAREMLDAR